MIKKSCYKFHKFCENWFSFIVTFSIEGFVKSFKNMKNLLLIAVISVSLMLSDAQNPEGFPDCNPAVVTWHAHPYACTK